LLLPPVVQGGEYTSGWADRWANESGIWWTQCIGYNTFWTGEFETVENVGENFPVSEPFAFTNPLGRYIVYFDERVSPTDPGDPDQGWEVAVEAGETVVVPVPSTGYYGVVTEWADGSTSWLDDRDWACLNPDCTVYGWDPPADSAAYELHEMKPFTVDTTPAGTLPELVIAEVMANPLVEDTGEFIELYNAGAADVDAAGLRISDGDKTDNLVGYEGGPSIISAGGHAVILDTEYAGEYEIPGETVLLSPTNSDIGNGLSPADPITLLTPDDIPIDTYWHPFNPGNGISVERIDLDAGDTEDNWLPSPCGWTPGEDNCAAWQTFPLVLSEVMANPIVEKTGEYVELFNSGDRTLNAGVFILYDGDSYDLIRSPYYMDPPLIPAGRFAVILDRDFNDDYVIPEEAIVLTTGNKTLGNSLSINDPVMILRWDLEIVDSWSSPFNPGNGISVEKIDLTAGDTPENWLHSPCGHSPGELNCASGEVPLDLVLSEIMANPLNEYTGEYVELYNLGIRQVNATTLQISDGDKIDLLRPYKGSRFLIQPGEYALILDRNFRNDYPLPEDIVLLTTPDYAIGNMISVDDPIVLFRWDREAMDTYTYPFDPGNGISAEKVDLEGGDTEENWVAAPGGNSPGLPNGPF